MKERGFTLTELLIMIAAITLLMLILLPALKRARDNRIRAACANNLRQIGQAMFIYSNDYDDDFPRAAGPNSTWGTTPDWRADRRTEAYSLNPGSASISASLYLLVKYSETPPESFICPTDTSAAAFIPGDYSVGKKKMIDLWDFGPDPSKHCSYAYHLPYGTYSLISSFPPGVAVAADRSPWLDTPGRAAGPITDFTAFDPNGTKDARNRGNAVTHQGDGQNVVFMDGHTAFEKNSACGVKNDNIYTSQNATGIRKGALPTLTSQPANRLDSLLVHDPPLKAGK